MKKPNGYWTHDRCKEEARDFRIGCISAYNKSLKNNWLNIICKY